MAKFVFVCVSIFVFVYFLSFCVYFVYSYSYLRRICVFPAFSAARSPLLLTSRHLPVNAGDDRWDSPAPFINRLQPAATVFPGVFANFDPVFLYFCHECTAKIVFVPPTLFLFQPEPIKCLKESAEMWKTTKLFYKLSFCWSVPEWFWTPKTCFTLGLESLWHIYSYKTALKVARGAPMIGREKSIEEQTKWKKHPAPCRVKVSMPLIIFILKPN